MIDQKQPKNEKYFNYLGRMITNDEKYAREIKCFYCHGNRSIQLEDNFYQQIGLKFKEETSKVLRLEHSLKTGQFDKYTKIPEKF